VSRPDLDQIDRDELAERRAERDRHREPGRQQRSAPDLTRRHIFQIGVTDSVNTSLDSAIVPLWCPACRGPVFATSRSNGERVDCFACDARLVTRLGIEGVAVELVTGGEP